MTVRIRTGDLLRSPTHDVFAPNGMSAAQPYNIILMHHWLLGSATVLQPVRFPYP
jgi:hypothetical protein